MATEIEDAARAHSTRQARAVGAIQRHGVLPSLLRPSARAQRPRGGVARAALGNAVNGRVHAQVGGTWRGGSSARGWRRSRAGPQPR